MSRYPASAYHGNYDIDCPQGVFIPSYTPPTLSPVIQPGEQGPTGPQGPQVSTTYLESDKVCNSQQRKRRTN